jgi:hypothetical protein
LLISVSGCTQIQPPGLSKTLISDNRTGLPQASPSPADGSQRIDRSSDPGIKPAAKGPESQLNLGVHPDGKWQIVLTGADALTLYQLMEKKPERIEQQGITFDNKIGKHVYCTRFEIIFCALFLNAEEGSLSDLEAAATSEYQDAELTLEEPRFSTVAEFDAVSTGKFGRLLLDGENARKVYDGLQVPVNELTEKSGNEKQVSVKNGKMVSCKRSIYDRVETYHCRFYFNYNNGKFDEILNLY